MIDLNAKYVRNKSISECKNLMWDSESIWKSTCPSSAQNLNWRNCVVKLYHHHPPNLQGQELKKSNIPFFVTVRVEGKFGGNMVIGSTHSGITIQKISLLYRVVKTEHLFNAINVQCGNCRRNLVTSRVTKL